jgi:hypothetical protein
MYTGEVLYLILVLLAFGGFSGALALASWRTRTTNE